MMRPLINVYHVSAHQIKKSPWRSLVSSTGVDSVVLKINRHQQRILLVKGISRKLFALYSQMYNL